MKGKNSQAAAALTETEKEAAEAEVTHEDVNKIIFACDAGMGSSAMGASILRNKVKKQSLISVSPTRRSTTCQVTRISSSLIRI